MTSLHIADTDQDPNEGDEHFGAEHFSGPDPLFTGDVGQLPQAVRVALVTLLRRRYIAADRHPTEWRLVLENELALRTRLHDLFLELVVDRTYEVAYKRQAVSDTGSKFPTLLYDQAYNREDTILLVYLRRLTRSRQQAGDDAVFVDRAELIDEVATFRPASATNHVQDTRSAANAVDNLLKNDILLRTTVADRFRVAPIIEVLLPVDRIQDLARWLHSQNGEDTAERLAESGDAGEEIP